MDKGTTKLALTEYLFPLCHKNISSLTQEHDLDRYVKKLNAITTSKLFVFAQLMQIKHYTDISLQLNKQKKLQKVVGLTSISTSQLSRKWRDLDYTFLERVFQHVVKQLKVKYGVAKANRMLGKIHLVDSSTITLCLSQYRWATYNRHKGAVRLHLRFIQLDYQGHPDVAVLTRGNVADRKMLDDLVVEDVGALNVFDRGYVDYEKYDEYCEKSVRFVTRLKHNADFKVIQEREVPPDSDILRDAVIWLGFRGTRYKMKNHLRLIECKDQDGELMLICTNDFDMSVEEIRAIYRCRWKIEMFFKWIKQHLYVKNFYGKSENAVYNQIFAALIAYTLGLLMRANAQYPKSLLDFIKQLRISWGESYRHLLCTLAPPPSRASPGRQQVDVERIYAEVCKQCDKGESEYLDVVDKCDLFL